MGLSERRAKSTQQRLIERRPPDSGKTDDSQAPAKTSRWPEIADQQHPGNCLKHSLNDTGPASSSIAKSDSGDTRFEDESMKFMSHSLSGTLLVTRGIVYACLVTCCGCHAITYVHDAVPASRLPRDFFGETKSGKTLFPISALDSSARRLILSAREIN